MPSPAAAGVLAATVFAYPSGVHTYVEALPVLAMIVVPAVLMVSTMRFRSFKNLDLRARQKYPVLLLVALGLASLAAQPEIVLVVVAYGYLFATLVESAWHRCRRRPDIDTPEDDALPQDTVSGL